MKDILTPTLRVTDIRTVTLNRAQVTAAKVWVIHPNTGDFVFGGEFTSPLCSDMLAQARAWLSSLDD